MDRQNRPIHHSSSKSMRIPTDVRKPRNGPRVRCQGRRSKPTRGLLREPRRKPPAKHFFHVVPSSPGIRSLDGNNIGAHASEAIDQSCKHKHRLINYKQQEGGTLEDHEYYEVKISAEDQEQAETILNSLLEKKLVTGGQFLSSPARFLWDGEINDMPEYVTITSYTISPNVQALMDDVRRTSEEQVPMVTFVAPVAMNSELQDWIDATLGPVPDAEQPDEIGDYEG